MRPRGAQIGLESGSDRLIQREADSGYIAKIRDLFFLYTAPNPLYDLVAISLQVAIASLVRATWQTPFQIL